MDVININFMSGLMSMLNSKWILPFSYYHAGTGKRTPDWQIYFPAPLYLWS